MDKIYVFGIFTGYSSYGVIRDAEPCGDVNGYAVDSMTYDNKMNVIANHSSSGETWCKHDMGITSDWKHDIYGMEHPNGYELIWLGCFKEMKDAYEVVVERFASAT